MMFFKALKVISWFTAQCRRILYNFAFTSRFKYFGKGCILDINGNVKIGKNVFIGDYVSLIVEKGATLTIADNSFIGENCYIKCYGGNIEIGENVSINSKCFLNGAGGLSIGNNTRIGTQSIMISSNHIFEDTSVLIKDQGTTRVGVSIGENVWFGARVTVLDGITVASHVVVGACGLVNKSILERGVYVGIPARKVKDI